jgi:WD40 repeat protein/tRNA A-37 threonylcarbamoyl transferase component Bud32
MTNLIGKSLGRYRIVEQHGEGGMATVYKAFDTRLEMDVAVKVIRTEIFAPSAVERALKRFEQETKSLAKLIHPNIVKVIDYGEYESKPFLVMPYHPGGTLKQLLQGKPIPWQEALHLLLPIARALSYAHKRGMIHRDIKPSNILITEAGDPLLTDFGIAKIIDEETTVDLTGTNDTVGTPEYMAPELVTSKSFDARVDIYALGVVFYEMVTGRKPFQADTPMAVLFKHASEPLPPPGQFAPDLPVAVERVLVKALYKNPKDRYQSMDEFASALEECRKQPATSRMRDAAAPSKTADRDTGPKAIPPAYDEEATIDRILPVRPRPSKKSSKLIRSILFVGAGLLVIVIILGLASGNNINGLLSRVLPAIAPVASTETLTPTETATISPSATSTIFTTPSLAPSLAPTSTRIPPVLSFENAADIRQLALFGNIISSVAWSPDGKSLAVVFQSGVTLYDAKDFREIKRYAPEKMINDVAFSPDGSLLAMGSFDKTILLWNVNYSEPSQTLSGHTAGVNSVAFSPDGTVLASGSSDATVRLWRVSDGTLLQKLSGHTDGVSSVAFSSEGKVVVSGSMDGTIKLWQASDGALLQTLTGHTGGVTSIALSPDGATLASGSYDKTARLWRVADGAPLRTLTSSSGAILCVAFSMDGSDLAAGSSSGKTFLWRTSNGTLRRTLSGHSSGVSSLAFSPDGTTLASGSWDQVVWLWRVTDGLPIRKSDGHAAYIMSIAFSPDGKTLASGSNSPRLDYTHEVDTFVQLWQVSNGTISQTFSNPRYYYSRDVGIVAFSSDGTVVTGAGGLWRISDGQELDCWYGTDCSLEKMRLPSCYDWHDRNICRIFSPDGTLIASESEDSTIKLLRASDGTVRRTLSGHTLAVNSLAFSPDGSILASGARDNTIKLWRVSDGKLLRTLQGHTDWVWSVAFSSDGSIVASGSNDATVKLWRVSDGVLLQTLTNHSAEVTSVAFSSDGLWLASGSMDCTIRFWGIPG